MSDEHTWGRDRVFAGIEIAPVGLTVARIEVLAKRLDLDSVDHFSHWLRSKRGGNGL